MRALWAEPTAQHMVPRSPSAIPLLQPLVLLR